MKTKYKIIISCIILLTIIDLSVALAVCPTFEDVQQMQVMGCFLFPIVAAISLLFGISFGS